MDKEEFRKIEAKWQKKWKENKVFEVEADHGKKKYYLTTPYPYVSGLLHLGHLFTYIAPEVISRFKRMQGFDVLFKFGFHCTGSPIVTAARKVEEGDEKQISSLKKMEIEDKDIPKFADPEHWIEHFPKEMLIDLEKTGFSIDPRYTFITTSLNPSYNAMIEWQFRKLKDKGYVKKGKHPVVWCTKCNSPVGDHARAEGEGETPTEFTFLKFKMTDFEKDAYLIAATLRPETVYGQTNMWVGPDNLYVKAKVGNEVWFLSRPAVGKLKEQDKSIEIISEIKGKEFIGKHCIAPGIEREIICLPSEFCDINIGSGFVTSVPSHAPFDWMGLYDLQKSREECGKWGLDFDEINKIKPIGLINLEGWGEHPGIEICEKWKIKNQKEFEKLEKAKKEIYKAEHYSGVMNENAGPAKGMPVEKAKKMIKEMLIKENKADVIYELTGNVVCRCGTPSVVKIVSDQWFLEYNDPEWKKKAHECLDKMTMYPEKIRGQFEYVIDWLDHWACTREFGLGTKLPWAREWKIESLSDSTLQMAYCTISKYLEHPEDYGFSNEKIGDTFFDHVFLGLGRVEDVSGETGIPEEILTRMKGDFNHFYPHDFRNSAKDLIQNHLTFSIFNHAAIFPEKHWPKAYVINGRVMVNNEKMSKSKGNFFTMRELYKKHGADLIRMAAANAGEGVDDANFDMEFIDTANKRLTDFFYFATENYGKGFDDKRTIDDWFESMINKQIKVTTDNLDNMQFKSAVRNGFLDMARILKWYQRRTNGRVNKCLIEKFIETQIKMIAPIVPHFAEELWNRIGKEGFVSNAEWPEADESKIDSDADKSEELVENVMSDIQTVIRLSKIEKPKKLTVFISKDWKYKLFGELGKIMQQTRDFKEIMGRIMSDDKLKAHGMEITKMLPKFLKGGGVPETLDLEKEFGVLNGAKEFLEGEYDCKMEVIKADETDNPRAGKAMPGKPGIVVE